MKIENRDDVVRAYKLLFDKLDRSTKICIGELLDEAMNWQERLDSLNYDNQPESKRLNERAAQAQANVNMCRSIATFLKMSA